MFFLLYTFTILSLLSYLVLRNWKYWPVSIMWGQGFPNTRIWASESKFGRSVSGGWVNFLDFYRAGLLIYMILCVWIFCSRSTIYLDMVIFFRCDVNWHEIVLASTGPFGGEEIEQRSDNNMHISSHRSEINRITNYSIKPVVCKIAYR